MDALSPSIKTLRARLASGELSATALCEDTLARIALREPALGAMTDVAADSARAQAQAVDSARQRGDPGGALAGIPIAVKSNIDTAGAICDAGLPHLCGHRPAADAEVVARLRRAGAVIVGTTATDSGAFGILTLDVFNPTFADRVVGGSSGGSAAAVAAGLCQAALGTDTGGSVRIPAACCGIVGFKPTFGRVPTAGVRPLAASVDHVGVLARSVGDARAVMAVIDTGFAALPGGEPPRAPIIGIAQACVDEADPVVARRFRAYMAHCAALGCTLRDVALPPPATVLDDHLVLSLTEAALHYMEHEADLLQADMAALPRAARESLRQGLAYPAHAHLRALRGKATFAQDMQAAFAQVDFIAMPTLPLPAPTRAQAGEAQLLARMIRYTAPFNQSGHPALALPWRHPAQPWADSIQLVGPLHSDRRLLALGEWLQARIDPGDDTP